MVYKMLQNLAPAYLQSYFVPLSPSICTWSSFNFFNMPFNPSGPLHKLVFLCRMLFLHSTQLTEQKEEVGGVGLELEVTSLATKMILPPHIHSGREPLYYYTF